jgi:hypothetical protein
MELTDVQKQTVSKWVAEKRSIAEIQKLLAEQFSVSMTYLDVRFLLLDLGLEVKDKDIRRTAKPPDLAAAPDRGEEPDLAEDAGAPGRSRVSVTLDQVVRAGALFSGTVTFSDGTKAVWMLDQTGRLAVDAGKRTYRPSPEDVETFTKELDRLLQKRGV